jgi:hypothetical protein
MDSVETLSLDNLKELIKQNDEKSNNIIIEYLDNKNVYDFIYPHGENLLHWCATFDNFIICEYLIVKKNLHVNLENYRFTTPLYYGAMSNSLNTIKILLKHHANPKIKSGFSGMFPIEITTNSNIKNELLEVDKFIPLTSTLTLKQEFNIYDVYKYRLYIWWLSNLNYLNCKNKHTVTGIELIEEANKIFQEKGIAALANKCQLLLEDFYNKQNNNNYCLNCHNVENLKRCSKCKVAKFCNSNCQLKALKIHKIDCK